VGWGSLLCSVSFSCEALVVGRLVLLLLGNEIPFHLFQKKKKKGRCRVELEDQVGKRGSKEILIIASFVVWSVMSGFIEVKLLLMY